ncbi:hypothetical protein EST38_g6875 [Candolleomyces aberdarensis]|uniref:Serine aminopeptidase S33 domain-containing protein n=1 Tax=Candolleomyces aberdarensis TaxID=2316362 RepID=A0A4Q2DH29_9AGAR|nr:hypothetical protein EST38_g6875 [Candolleomyces aberdarensis]
MSATFSIHVHADGSKKAYEIFGQEHLGKQTPLVLVNGMSMLRGDWLKLSDALSQYRPVALNWKKVAICGYSMGGAITQQLLFLPFHPSNPAALPFEVSHVFLTATLCEPQQDTSFAKRFQSIPPPPEGRKRTFEEKREVARPTTAATFDPNWIAENPDRFNWWLDRMATGGRPVRTILMQARALGRFDFTEFQAKVPKDTKILVIHGKLDEVLPYSASRVILERMPSAKDVEVGDKPGQIPSLDFGHQWFEYFDIEVWRNVFEVFLSEPPAQSSGLARL